MRFEIVRKKHPNLEKFPAEDIELAKKFCEGLKKELGPFLKSVVLFGSVARTVEAAGPATLPTVPSRPGDVDVLVVVDDLSIVMSDEVIEAYKLIVEHLVADISYRLHITTMSFTSFWEYSRSGDPVVINILRDGLPLYDVGFFEPLQVLLAQGRIRPTKESVFAYYGRSPRTLLNARWHVLQATLDLYWAVIDAAHAALMAVGEMPPTPEHAASLLRERFVKTKKLEEKYAAIMDEFFTIQKKIVHRETKEITGKAFDEYLRKANDFVIRLKNLIEDEIAKKPKP